MELLEKRILKDGTFKDGGILKVDSFLNHQMDIELINELGKEFARRFAGKKITKILTVEASGIGIACIAAQYFHVPVIFAKKAQSKNLDGDIYTSSVMSFTHGQEYIIRVSKKFLESDDCVLIIDDFLANGKALIGLMDIIEQASANLVGCGICIEKGFQEGGAYIRSLGVDLQSLAIIDMDENGKMVFRKENE
jgi:xanthine phosphoribosyltransferase